MKSFEEGRDKIIEKLKHEEKEVVKDDVLEEEKVAKEEKPKRKPRKAKPKTT